MLLTQRVAIGILRPHSVLLSMCFVCGTAWVVLSTVTAPAHSQEQGKKDLGKPELANEIVMVPGMEIEATNELGKITIVAGPGLQRTYKWEGCEGSVEMW